MDINKARNLIEETKKIEPYFFDYTLDLEQPFLGIVENDIEGLRKFLKELNIEDLYWISGIFSEIGYKWDDTETIDLIENLFDKLREAGYSVSW